MSALSVWALALDPLTHDLFITADGNLGTCTSFEEVVALRIKCRLLTMKGEWYQNPELGVAYVGSVLLKNPNLPAVRALFASVISAVDGVLRVDSLDLVLDKASRTLSTTFVVTCTNGGTATGSL